MRCWGSWSSPAQAQPLQEQVEALCLQFRILHQHPFSRATSSKPTGERPHQLTTLVIGDSVISNVRTSSTITCCFQGATVSDVADKVTEILANEPDITKVIVHIGTNDICKQLSEILKTDFVHLFSTQRRSVSQINVSGPIPSCGRGSGRFSPLHTWLSSTYAANGVSYIDNFNLFWEGRQLFRYDDIHLNWLEEKLLSGNISHSVAHPCVPLSCSQNSSLTSTWLLLYQFNVPHFFHANLLLAKTCKMMFQWRTSSLTNQQPEYNTDIGLVQ